MFIYCVSPVHMGAGSSLGVIDNPIQRERHTRYPTMAGSGIKGALRQYVEQTWPPEGNGRTSSQPRVLRIFGPEPRSADEHAGAISFTDAQLVLFPVRSLKSTYVYATCPTALARARRTLALACLDADWSDLSVSPGHCRVVRPALLRDERDKKLVLESFEFECKNGQDAELCVVAEWLAEHAMPQDEGHRYFREKLQEDLVMLSDDDFRYFVENSTVVEAHVRIDDESGTASDGGLFYTENLPPECLLLSMAMATQERGSNGTDRWKAADVMDAVVKGSDACPGLHGQLVQFGGDATTGRGLAVLTFAEKEDAHA